MRPQRIEWRNFKGGTGSLDLTSRLMLLTGPNGSGKSRVIQAVAAAIIGYDPVLGKQRAKDLVSNDLQEGESCSVELQAGIGTPHAFTIERTLAPRHRLAITNDGKTIRGLAEGSGAIASFYGAGSYVDVPGFLSMTAGKRAEWLLTHMGAGEMLKKDVLEQCSDLSPAALEMARSALAGWSDRMPATTNLFDSVERAKATVSGLVSARDRAAAALAEASRGDDSGAEKLPPLPAITRELEEVTERWVKARELVAASESAAKTIADLQANAQLQEESAEGWREEVAEADERLKIREQEAESAAKAMEALQGEDPGWSQEELDSIQQSLGENTANLQALEVEVERIAAALAGLDGDGGEPTCHHCLQIIGDDAHDALQSAWDRMAEQRDLLKAAISDQSKRRRDLREAHSEHRAKMTAAKREMDAAAANVAGAVKIRDTAQREADAATARAEESRVSLKSAQAGGDIDALRALEAGAKQQKESLEAQRDLKAGADKSAAERISKRSAARQAGKDVEEARAAKRRLEDVARAFIAQHTEPLEQLANRFLDSAGRDDWALRLVLSGRGGIDVAVDSSSGDREVRTQLATLSGGEQVLACTAIGLAILEMTNPACRILTMECAELDEESLAHLMRALEQIPEKFADQVILATCNDPIPMGGSAWRVHRTG